MRLPRLLTAIVLLVLVCAATSAIAVPRTMLVESFTNTSCVPCAGNNPIVHQFMQAYAPGLVINVQPHVWWPGATDPFYLLTQVESASRVSYYDVNGVPTTVCDGVPISTHSYAALEAAAAHSVIQDSPLAISFEQSSDGSNVTLRVWVEAQGVVPVGDYRLRVALVESEIVTPTPPGANGETEFYYTMRRMLPTAIGTTVTLAEWEPETYEWTTAIDPAWDYSRVHAVAWIQENLTEEVLQAASNVPKPAYQFFYGAEATGDILPMGTLRTFASVLVNGGASADTYDLHIAPNLPVGWSASVCANGICYPPWTTDIAVPVGASARDSVTVDIASVAGAPGTGSVTIVATSQGDPTKTWTRTFQVITPGTKVLLVDNDSGQTFETYYQAAMNATGRSFSTWDRQSNGKLSTDKLAYFPIVVWIGGNTFPALDPDDRAALAQYLDDGGRLFLSGQDIGWTLCDPASAHYSAESLAWYQHYLGAQFISDDTNDLSLIGLAGDPIGDGLSFSLSSSGATIQTYPSEIQPINGAVGFLLYEAGREAAVHYENENYKVVYLAYGFEGQRTVSSRTQVMNRSLIFLDINAVAAPSAPRAPYLVAAPVAVPNPFNPATSIVFETGGSPAPVSVLLYDARGRQVRSLWSGVLQAGTHRFDWNGRDDAGQAVGSGVYLARVRAAGEERSIKLSLVR